MGKGEEGGQEGEKLSKKLPLKLSVWRLFKGRSVVYYSETLHVVSFLNETVEAGGFTEGRSSSGVMSST